MRMWNMENDDGFNVLALSEEEICDMYEKMGTVDLLYCFPSLMRSVAKNDDDGELFVSVIIFDGGYPERFILRENHRMKPWIEQQYLKYIHSGLLVIGDERRYNAFVRLINLAYRNKLHVTSVEEHVVLEHIYYRLCVASETETKSILYGGGLDYIAFNSKHIAFLDTDAKTITGIVRGKLSQDQLRLLNQKDMVKYLFSEDLMETFIYKYKTISLYFDLRCAKVNRLQFEYLFNTASKISSKKDVIAVFDFNRYDSLGQLPDWCESYLDE